MLAQQIKSSLETTKVLGVLQDQVAVFVSRELFRIAEFSIFIFKKNSKMHSLIPIRMVA
jgi:hypothetical protein